MKELVLVSCLPDWLSHTYTITASSNVLPRRGERITIPSAAGGEKEQDSSALKTLVSVLPSATGRRRGASLPDPGYPKADKWRGQIS